MNRELVDRLLDRMNHPLESPGTFGGFIDHPVLRRECVEIGVVMHHRFAFEFWSKWAVKDIERYGRPPNLLTIDWHDDVGGACDFIPEELEALNLCDENEVSLFCWAGLRSLDDGHIAPAQYLNVIGDTYVILKQHRERRRLDERYRTREVVDRYGNPHRVHYYDSAKQFLAAHADDGVHRCIWDLDLDYFMRYAGDDFPDAGTTRPVSDRVIREFVSPSSPLTQWILPRLAGWTIALEPEYCGGVRNCMRFLDLVTRTVGDPPLLSHGMRWKRSTPRRRSARSSR